MMFELAFVGLRSASLQWQYHVYPSCKFSSGFSAYPKSEKGPNRGRKINVEPHWHLLSILYLTHGRANIEGLKGPVSANSVISAGS
jgi:hypothetical protein